MGLCSSRMLLGGCFFLVGSKWLWGCFRSSIVVLHGPVVVLKGYLVFISGSEVDMCSGWFKVVLI